MRHITLSPKPPDVDPPDSLERERRRVRLRRLLQVATVLFVGNVLEQTWLSLPKSKPVSLSEIGSSIKVELATRYVDWQASRRRARIAPQTDEIPPVDRIEIYALDETITPAAGFPLHPGTEFATIYARAVAVGAEAETIARLWRDCEFDDVPSPTGALGGYCPQYGLRFFSAGELLLEAPLLWHPQGSYTSVVDGSAGRIALNFYDPREQLLDHLQNTVPLPPHRRVEIHLRRAWDDLFAAELFPDRKNIDLALAIDPLDSDARFLLGRWFQRTLNSNAAILEYGRSIESAPTRGAHFHRGEIHAVDGRLDAAIADFSNALDTTLPEGNYFLVGDTTIRYLRGKVYVEVEDYLTAILDLNDAIRGNANSGDLKETELAEALRHRADAWEALGFPHFAALDDLSAQEIEAAQAGQSP